MAMGRCVLVNSFFFGLMQGLVYGSCDGVTEPCYLYNTFEMPYLSTRHPDIALSAETRDDKYCDLFAINPDTWYRSDYNMTTHVVEQQACGANEPIWLNGTIPEPGDGIVSKVACVKSFSDDCGWTYTVKVKSCQYYSVYCFPAVPNGCHQRYCFDVNLTAVTTSTTTTSTTTTTTTTTTETPSTQQTNKQNRACLSTRDTTDDKDCSQRIALAIAMTVVAIIVVFGIPTVSVFYYHRRKVEPSNNPKVKEKYAMMDDGKPTEMQFPVSVVVSQPPLQTSLGFYHIQ